MKIKIVSLVHIFLVFMLSSLVGIPFMTATAYASAEDSNPLRSDVNGDGIVNISDVATVSIAWVSQVGHQNWDPRADLDNDGEVNVSDMVLVTKDFGMTWLRYDFNGPLDWNVVSGTWRSIDQSALALVSNLGPARNTPDAVNDDRSTSTTT